MQVFLSWSGSRASRLADVLHDWIPDVLQVVKPWKSDVDVQKGEHWFSEIHAAASKPGICILCTTPENQNSTWLHFEAGLAAHALSKSRVIPLLLALSPDDIRGPLAQFQVAVLEYEDVLKLLAVVNRSLGELALSDDKLRRAFDNHWPGLQSEIQLMSKDQPAAAEPRTLDLLKEILGSVRSLERHTAAVTPQMNQIMAARADPREIEQLSSRFGTTDKQAIIVTRPQLTKRESAQLLRCERLARAWAGVVRLEVCGDQASASVLQPNGDPTLFRSEARTILMALGRLSILLRGR